MRKEYQELDEKFSLLNRDSLTLETDLQDLYELLGDQKAFLSALPTRKPAIGYYTSGFGVRKSPIGGKIKMHEGLDIANHLGTPIRAPADGVVIFAAAKSGYGQTVILDHGYGLETWYGPHEKDPGHTRPEGPSRRYDRANGLEWPLDGPSRALRSARQTARLSILFRIFSKINAGRPT